MNPSARSTKQVDLFWRVPKRSIEHGRSSMLNQNVVNQA
jgi:hypothetical protein